jgi:hypothetical protein
MASLCVREGKGEVYAVGLQFSEVSGGTNGTITLTIAGNNGVPDEVSNHLHNIWLKLRDIAEVCHIHYNNKGMPYPITYDGDSSPSNEALNGANHLVLRLCCDIYRHSLRKFAARVDKRSSAFFEFAEALEEYWQHQVETDEAARQGFYKAVKFIKTIKAILSRKEEDINFNFLSNVMASLQRIVLSLLKSRRLNSWCIQVEKCKLMLQYVMTEPC